MDLVSKIFIRNRCYICETVLGQLMDLVSKIVIRNHCYICEKVLKQLMDLVLKFVIRHQCYIYFFFITNHYYINNILIDRVAFKRDQIPIYYTNVKSPQVVKRGECIQHGDRALATVKILENSVFLYTLLDPWGIKESERYTIIFIYITVHKYTQYLLMAG